MGAALTNAFCGVNRMSNNAAALKNALSLPYETAEWQYRSGILDETDWDLYRFYWRNSVPRFSDIAREFEIKENL